MATTYRVRPRNGQYGVDLFRDGKMIRNVLLFDRRRDAEDAAGELGNAYDQGANDQKAGTYKFVIEDDDRETVAEGDKHLYKPPGAADR